MLSVPPAALPWNAMALPRSSRAGAALEREGVRALGQPGARLSPAHLWVKEPQISIWGSLTQREMSSFHTILPDSGNRSFPPHTAPGVKPWELILHVLGQWSLLGEWCRANQEPLFWRGLMFLMFNPSLVTLLQCLFCLSLFPFSQTWIKAV